jgi:hypothetical protein
MNNEPTQVRKTDPNTRPPVRFKDVHNLFFFLPRTISVSEEDKARAENLGLSFTAANIISLLALAFLIMVWVLWVDKLKPFVGFWPFIGLIIIFQYLKILIAYLVILLIGKRTLTNTRPSP